MIDAAVIGAGLFGCIIAAALRAAGAKVEVFDDAQPLAGSRPAACLMKHSWYSSLGKDVYTAGLDQLGALYQIHAVTFKVGVLNVPVRWIDPNLILQPPDYKTTVTGIIKRGSHWAVQTSGGTTLASSVVVAAGVWSQLLVPSAVQRGLTGVAFLWREAHIARPVIRPWAPYRQLVAFNRGDGLWASDGSAIKAANWNEGHERAALNRCLGILSHVPNWPPTKLVGIRPYTEAKPALLKEVKPGLWVASGGAKNGTLAAGWCAAQLRGALC